MRRHFIEPLEPRQLLTGSVDTSHVSNATGFAPAGDVIPAAAPQAVVQAGADTSDHVDAAAVRDQLIRFVDTWNGGRLGKAGTSGMGTYAAAWDGLFRMNLDRQFNPVGAFSNDMTVISQSRAIYMNVEAYRNAPAGEQARFKAAVQRGADYLLAKAVDRTNYNGKPGGMWWGLQDDGVSPPTHTRQVGGRAPRDKHAYGQVQSLFALAQAYTVTGDADHLDGAFAQLDVWNSQFADTAAGPGAFLQDANENYTQRLGTRNLDYMTHAFEALLTLDDATPATDPRKAALAGQVTAIGNFITTRMYRDAPGSGTMGYLPWYYDAQWNPSADPAQRYSTPGHNFEVAFLLSRAAERGFNPAWLAVANKLVAYSLRYGFDNVSTSRTYGAVPYGKIAFDGSRFDATPPNFVWWHQAEAARALLHFAAVRGRTDLWDEYDAASAFIQNHFVDSVYGGWFPQLSPSTLAPAVTNKGDVWTGGYHETMLDAERIRVAAMETSARVYQAEAATVVGGKRAADRPGYTGSGYVDYVGRFGEYVEFAVDAPAAGDYVLDFRYANGGTYDRPLELKVNGQVVRSKLAFPGTGSWNNWGTSTASVALPAGRSTVRLTAGVVSGPNLDALTLRRPPTQTQTLQAETATLSGATVQAGNAGYTGTGYADFTNATGDSVEWKVNVAAAGQYRLTFRYANGGTSDRPLDLGVNGQLLSPRLSFVPTGGWTVWKDVGITVTLAQGENTVRLTTSGLNGANIDRLEVAPAAG
jgi:mannose/cellobiose epimerase-like protein (N-acyl-D-glucosamine 2-epimerase family)